ncbi:MAG: tryptophan synthase subunit alpha [Cyanobacteria bacterium P01_C01_bin.89]
MTSVSERFAQLRDREECALIPFITAGDPSLEATGAALKALDQNGADFIELGVPYADPLADGPTIQAAATRSLARGTKLDDVLKLVSEVSPDISAPIILFTYYNPILNRGVETFLKDIKTAGAAGLVVPDLPLEEADSLLKPAAEIGIEVTLLIAPTSPVERMEAIAQQSQGFIYLVSVTGVTGMRTQMQTRVAEVLAQVREVTDKPVGIGFGISGPEQARQVRGWGADGAIVGSACVKLLADGDEAAAVKNLGDFCKSLKAVLTE